MFVGHYAVSLCLKRSEPEISLGWSFVAVQLLDVLWAAAVLAGIEHVRIVAGFLPASPLDLYDLPWTHSLAAALAWSGLFALPFRSPLLGAAVFSHWVLDFVAHRPDLPLFPGGPKVGLGLWHSVPGTIVVECGLLLAGLIVYMRVSRPRTPAGRYAMPLFATALAGMWLWTLSGPPPPGVTPLALGGEAGYIGIALAAAWLDRMRAPRAPGTARPFRFFPV